MMKMKKSPTNILTRPIGGGGAKTPSDGPYGPAAGLSRSLWPKWTHHTN